MPRVIHFEISVDQPERAARFYSMVFGWKIEKWPPVDYWLASTGEGPGIDGALRRRDDPAVTTINTIDVPSIDEYISRIERHGGRVLTPKMAISGIGYHTYCKDTEGNIFGIMEENSSVK